MDINRDNRPHRGEFVDALAAVVDSGRFLFGPDVVDLGEDCRLQWRGQRCWLPRGAMHYALAALNMGPGDEVIVPVSRSLLLSVVSPV